MMLWLDNIKIVARFWSIVAEKSDTFIVSCKYFLNSAFRLSFQTIGKILEVATKKVNAWLATG
jgi:hypothetical protein